MFFSLTGKIADIRKLEYNSKTYAEIIIKKKFFNKDVDYCFFVTYYPIIQKIENCEIEIGNNVQIKFTIQSRIKNDKYFTNLLVETVDVVSKKSRKKGVTETNQED
jgi:hypothetical protein